MSAWCACARRQQALCSCRAATGTRAWSAGRGSWRLPRSGARGRAARAATRVPRTFCASTSDKFGSAATMLLPCVPKACALRSPPAARLAAPQGKDVPPLCYTRRAYFGDDASRINCIIALLCWVEASRQPGAGSRRVHAWLPTLPHARNDASASTHAPLNQPSPPPRSRRQASCCSATAPRRPTRGIHAPQRAPRPPRARAARV